MLRIVHEKHERHEKNIRCRLASSPAFIHRLPRQVSYVIHPGLWDAGTQAQGGETSCCTSIYGMCRHSDSPWPGVGQEAGLPGNVLMCFNYYRVFRGLRFLLWACV